MKKKEKKESSNKSFGIVFFIVFFIIGLWPLLNSGGIRVWALLIGVIFLLLGLFNSKILTPLNKLWIKFGELLGKIISPIIMSLLYFFVVTPIGFIMTILLKKDLLSTKFNKESSYWIKRAKNIGSMKKQF